MENMLRVGVITSTHGVRGEVKVFPTTDDAKRFKKLKTVILDTGKGQTTLEIEQVKFFKNMVILKFKGYDNINDVETWRQKDLLITREQAVTLQPDEYFITDLIGLLVKDDTGAEVGTVKDVLETGANDVYVAVSYTHLDVYKRQGMDFDTWFAKNPEGIKAIAASFLV